MKKTVTYREITVAIGIVVAMVIVLTLWVRIPAKTVSNPEERPRFELRFSAEGLVNAAEFPWF